MGFQSGIAQWDFRVELHRGIAQLDFTEGLHNGIAQWDCTMGLHSGIAQHIQTVPFTFAQNCTLIYTLMGSCHCCDLYNMYNI